MIRRLGVAVAVVALGGCGVDPPTDQERLAIDRLVEAELSGDEERCILAGLADLGITAGRIVDGDLNADEDGEVLAATLECVDDLAAVEGFVDSFIAGRRPKARRSAATRRAARSGPSRPTTRTRRSATVWASGSIRARSEMTRSSICSSSNAVGATIWPVTNSSPRVRSGVRTRPSGGPVGGATPMGPTRPASTQVDPAQSVGGR